MAEVEPEEAMRGVSTYSNLGTNLGYLCVCFRRQIGAREVDQL